MNKLIKGFAAFIICFMLSGCVSVALNRDVNVEGMNLSVPSSWAETDNKYTNFGSIEFDGPADKDGYVTDAIIVQYNNNPSYTNIEDITTSYLTNTKMLDAPIIGKYVKDGASMYVFDGSSDSYQYHFATIYSQGTEYEITVLGDAVNINDVVNTISF